MRINSEQQHGTGTRRKRRPLPSPPLERSVIRPTNNRAGRRVTTSLRSQ
jgi:hypothetical protein